MLCYASDQEDCVCVSGTQDCARAGWDEEGEEGERDTGLIGALVGENDPRDGSEEIRKGCG